MRRSSNLVGVLATVGLMGVMAISACKSSDQSPQASGERRQVSLDQRRRVTSRRRRNGAPATPALPRAATDRPLTSGSGVGTSNGVNDDRASSFRYASEFFLSKYPRLSSSRISTKPAR